MIYTPTGKFGSHYLAKVQAIQQVAHMIYNSDSDCAQAAIFIDTPAAD